MELVLLEKGNMHKVIPAEDEFFYPLVFNTPLLQGRFVGKRLQVKLKNNFQVSGVFLGVIGRPLAEFFKEHAEYKVSSSFLEFDSEHDWLAGNLRSKFDGLRVFSLPKAPPYFVVLQELQDFLVFVSYSEAEQADLPKINYNLIITNDAIDRLSSFLKRSIPRAKRTKHKKKKRSAGARQLRLGRFLKA